MADRILTPADHEDLVQSLSFALRYDRRGKRTYQRDDLTARAAAEHLAEALRRGNFVVMRGPPIGDSAPKPVMPASYQDRTD